MRKKRTPHLLPYVLPSFSCSSPILAITPYPARTIQLHNASLQPINNRCPFMVTQKHLVLPRQIHNLEEFNYRRNSLLADQTPPSRPSTSLLTHSRKKGHNNHALHREESLWNPPKTYIPCSLQHSVAGLSAHHHPNKTHKTSKATLQQSH